MFILRILLKTALLPVVLILLFVKVIVKVGMQLSSIILGGLILFVAGCLIYTITKQAWSQTFLLALIEAGISISPSKFQTTVEMKLYEYALIQWYMRPVAEVNRLLVEAEVQPLTNLVEGFDENGWKVVNE